MAEKKSVLDDAVQAAVNAAVEKAKAEAAPRIADAEAKYLNARDEARKLEQRIRIAAAGLPDWAPFAGIALFVIGAMVGYVAASVVA